MNANIALSPDMANTAANYAMSVINHNNEQTTIFDMVVDAIRALSKRQKQQRFCYLDWGYARVKDGHIEIGLFDEEGTISVVLGDIEVLAVVGMTPERDLFFDLVKQLKDFIPRSNISFYLFLGMMDEYKRYDKKTYTADAVFQIHQLALQFPIEPKSPSKTYLMIDKDTKCIKIGKSKDPCFREGTLQSKKPTIKLIAVCSSDVEKELHKIYSKRRIRGEWFRLTKRDVDTIINQYGFDRISHY